MRRTFLTNLSLLLFLNLLVKPFWVLGIDRSVQNIVGSADYGFYFALFNFSFLLNIFLDAGITGQNNREIAQNPNLLKDRFQKIIPIRIVLGVIYAIATIKNWTEGNCSTCNGTREFIRIRYEIDECTKN